MSDHSNLRECAFDSETTGFSPKQGHRMVELAVVEMIDKVQTGRTFHRFLNPERAVPAEVVKIHGLTTEFLSDKPKFKQIAAELLEFIGDAPIVAHNAGFDMSFLNSELERIGIPALTNSSIDTVSLAKKRFPGGKITLDDLCRKFNISLAARTQHGALIDTKLLAEVYLELCGGRQRSADFAGIVEERVDVLRPYRAPRILGLASEEETARHQDFLSRIKEPIWSAVLASDVSPALPAHGRR
jgi:DNA polymerase-3 subunit epsilon